MRRSAAAGLVLALIAVLWGAGVAEAEPPEGVRVQLCPLSPTIQPSVERIGGADRFEVAVHASQQSYPDGADAVFLASGSGFADALSGSAAAGHKGGPVLLVARDSVPSIVTAELRRLAPRDIVVLGGLATISADLEKSIRGLASNITRIDGADRYEVSATLAGWAFAPSDILYVASGEKYSDALSASAAAGNWGVPVILTAQSSLPPAVLSYIRDDAALENIIVVGGPATISDSVVETLSQFAPVSRTGGADRFVVSAATSAQAFCKDVPTVYVASGEVFADALSGSSSAIAAAGPVLLVTRDGIPDAVASELRRLQPQQIKVLGGPATISQSVVDDLANYLRPQAH
jgi:putative cell wall-binding protein